MDVEEIDRDGAIAEALEELGMTRGQALKRAAGGMVGAGALGGLLVAAPAASAKSRKTDVKVLQAALVFENLGVTFYGLAANSGKLSGDTQLFAETVHAHEVAHAAFVSNAIRALGGTPAAPPKFHFGSIPRSPKRFRATAQAIEQLCVQVINGAGPLVTRPTLAAAGELVSVEARHVSWIRQISGVTPVPNAFDTTKTVAQAQAIVKSKGFIQS
jgi:hypothetical protein